MAVFRGYSKLLLLAVLSALGFSCPDGWIGHEGSCYIFMKETYNWFDAKAECNILDGYLVEDTSDSVHQFLKGLAETHGAQNDVVWIGLQDFVEENVFVWTYSGMKAQTTFWLPTEPQDAHGEEDCVAMTRGGWVDINCEDSRAHFICEKEPSDESMVG